MIEKWCVIWHVKSMSCDMWKAPGCNESEVQCHTILLHKSAGLSIELSYLFHSSRMKDFLFLFESCFLCLAYWCSLMPNLMMTSLPVTIPHCLFLFHSFMNSNNSAMISLLHQLNSIIWINVTPFVLDIVCNVFVFMDLHFLNVCLLVLWSL